MAITYNVALPFIRTEDGTAPGEAQECQSEGTAIISSGQTRACRTRSSMSWTLGAARQDLATDYQERGRH